VLGIFKIGSQKLFAWGWLWTTILLLSASSIPRITDVSHQRLARATDYLWQCWSCTDAVSATWLWAPWGQSFTAYIIVF
jgi:hypothetical protein